VKTDIPIVFGSGTATAFELSHIEKHDDGSGWRAELALRSHPFECSHFHFDFDHLEKFAESIRRVDQSLSGTARLGHSYERDYIEFSMHTRGRLTVAGLLGQYGDHSQELRFSFGVDQSYLPAFISSIEQVLEAVTHAARSR